MIGIIFILVFTQVYSLSSPFDQKMAHTNDSGTLARVILYRHPPSMGEALRTAPKGHHPPSMGEALRISEALRTPKNS